MEQQFNMKHDHGINLNRPRGCEDIFKLVGRFNPVEHWRKGKLLAKYDVLNGIVNEGKNKIFNVMFNDAAAIANASWYLSLISSTGFSSLPDGDTMASHSGWTEFINYSQANRVAWGSVTSTTQSVSNTTPATFDINAGGTLKGLFVVSNNTKSGTTGVLWSTAQFAADIPVVNGDQMKVTYTVNA